MEQFVAVALAHFLALLIPGVDFFLIVRTTVTGGWRNATGVCVGIATATATANAIVIAAAFSGMALISNAAVLDGIQLFGGCFLIYVGIVFVRSSARIDLGSAAPTERRTWLRNLGLGVASGLMNPKNVLFYVSLGAAIGDAAPQVLVGYGLWMVTIVLMWDAFVAVALGSGRALARMSRVLPWLSRGAGVFLVLFGLGMVIELALPLVR